MHCRYCCLFSKELNTSEIWGVFCEFVVWSYSFPPFVLCIAQYRVISDSNILTVYRLLKARLSISSVLAMEILQSCTKQSILYSISILRYFSIRFAMMCQISSILCCAGSLFFYEYIFCVTISLRNGNGHLSFDIHIRTPVDLYRRISKGYFSGAICYQNWYD